MTRNLARIAATAATAMLIAASCGNDEPSASSPPPAPPASSDEAATSATNAAANTSAPATPGDGTSSVVLDGETMVLDRVLCHLESQPAAAGGGNILFVVQGYGSDSAGEPVMIDITRFDADSMFAGDDVQLYIGDITGDEVRDLGTTAPAGTVTLDGSTASVDALTVQDLAAGTEHTLAFEIRC